jgi:hypothetical protein
MCLKMGHLSGTPYVENDDEPAQANNFQERHGTL